MLVVVIAIESSREAISILLSAESKSIYEIDSERLRMTSVNDAMCEFSGYSREELLSMNPMDILDDQNIGKFQQSA